ncbi:MULTISPECIES: hypothetical protein [unclassified Achromobacter]|uniref:hypothetical protein n=1 Tax=unclassified Achromobacter TaxID=2626865 RepID=UPI00069E863E|nr:MULTISPECIES: hypothetical protein [unclassified Achromobacter]KOF55123.1 hypothetical protein AD428_02790 [Achromobacter sp. DMS1]
MSKYLPWIKRNLGLPLLMASITAITLGIYQAREATATQYAVLEQMYLDGTPEFRAALAELVDEPLSRWTYFGLSRAYWEETRALALPHDVPAPEIDSATARRALWDTVRQRTSRGRVP